MPIYENVFSQRRLARLRSEAVFTMLKLLEQIAGVIVLNVSKPLDTCNPTFSSLYSTLIIRNLRLLLSTASARLRTVLSYGMHCKSTIAHHHWYAGWKILPSAGINLVGLSGNHIILSVYHQYAVRFLAPPYHQLARARPVL